MHKYNGENFIMQPYQFGSLPSSQRNDSNVSVKRLIISGILSPNQDTIKTMLNKMNIKDYNYFNSNGGGTFIEKLLITFPTKSLAKEHQKIISDYLKTNNLDSIKVQFYEAKDERNVYVKNLPLHFKETELSELFQPYGSIISKKLIKKSMNNNSIGFVRYTSKEEAEKAISEINNKNLCFLNNERVVRCEFSKSSNPAANFETHKANNNYFSSSQVPRFQNVRHKEVPIPISNNFQNNSHYDYLQLANQFSNMYVSPNNQYYQGYNVPNVPIYMSYPGTYQGYPYLFYSPNNQNYNYPP